MNRSAVAVEPPEAQGEQHMAAVRLHGKKDRLGLEFRGQGEAKAEIGIAVGGPRQPRYLRVGAAAERGVGRKATEAEEADAEAEE